MKVVSVIGARPQFSKAAPMISGLFATGRMDDLQRMMSPVAKGILEIFLPVVLGLVVSGAWILSFSDQISHRAMPHWSF